MGHWHKSSWRFAGAINVCRIVDAFKLSSTDKAVEFRIQCCRLHPHLRAVISLIGRKVICEYQTSMLDPTDQWVDSLLI